MKTSYRMLWVWMLVWAGASAAAAAELELQGPRLVVTGLLDGSQAKAFVEHLDSGKVRTVVFVDSFGGTAEAAETYARAIRTAGVNTEALGQCYAACAWAFLAGKEHRFGRGLHVHGLLIPVATRPRPGETQKMMAEFAAAAGTSAPPATASATATAGGGPVETVALAPPAREKEVWQPDQGVLFQSTPTLFGRVYKTFYCDGSQGRDVSQCGLLPDADPYKVGVLTPWP